MLAYILIGITLAVVAVYAMPIVWKAIGAWQIRRAGPRPLAPALHVIWRDPGNPGTLDLVNGPGGRDGAPAIPFRFIEEHLSGSQPCVSVIDRHKKHWRVKWGDEVRSENFAVRLVWACGYFAEVTYFVPSGRIEGAKHLTRARDCIDPDCGFKDARFELEEPEAVTMFEEHSWSWTDNPFVGTRELNGLKILVMLLSNWDTKDRADVARGSNTAIFEYRVSRLEREARYLITDWGGSMGKWGGNIVTRGRWDPEGFAAQTPHFVTGVEDGIVRFGYVGQRTEIAEGIRVGDVQWLYKYLGRIRDEQIVEALRASGADDDEAARFARAIRDRISQLGHLAGNENRDSGQG